MDKTGRNDLDYFVTFFLQFYNLNNRLIEGNPLQVQIELWNKSKQWAEDRRFDFKIKFCLKLAIFQLVYDHFIKHFNTFKK